MLANQVAKVRRACCLQCTASHRCSASQGRNLPCRQHVPCDSPAWQVRAGSAHRMQQLSHQGSQRRRAQADLAAKDLHGCPGRVTRVSSSSSNQPAHCTPGAAHCTPGAGSSALRIAQAPQEREASEQASERTHEQLWLPPLKPIAAPLAQPAAQRTCKNSRMAASSAPDSPSGSSTAGKKSNTRCMVWFSLQPVGP